MKLKTISIKKIIRKTKNIKIKCQGIKFKDKLIQ
jgi:hypothetical protein